MLQPTIATDEAGTKPALRRGRPSKLTPEVWALIEQGVEGGLSLTRAGHLAGVSAESVSTWKQEKPEFAEAIARADSRGVQKRLAAIQSAADKEGHLDWRAQAWILERTLPKEFGDKTGADVAIQNTVNVAQITEAELADLRERRRRALGG